MSFVRRSSPRSRAAVCGALIVLLVGCGGGVGPDAPGLNASRGSGDKGGSQDAGNRAGASNTTRVLEGQSLPADAHLRGMWSPVYSWPLISVHAVLTPDGRVLTYGTDGTGKQTGYFIYSVWDPSLGFGPDAHTVLPNTTNTDLFCGSQVVLPQGDAIFLAGGDNWTGTGTTNTGNNNTNLFSLSDDSLTRGANMNRARWYSSATVLLNGEIFIQGGTGGTDFAEIRGVDGSFRLLTGASTSGLDYMYPRNFIAPDGRVFGYDSAGRMYYIDTRGNGARTNVGQFASAYRGNDASAAMFRPGRILQFGGNSSGAIVIDITAGAPVVAPTQSMSSQRRLVNAAILADGKVLATGGSAVWNQMTGVNNTAEIWNPETGSWLQGPAGSRARLYHSVSLLLPDASVLVSGGGAPGPQNNLNAEIYYPPYLFAEGGQLATRPVIASAPQVLDIGRTFAVQLGSGAPISRVTMVKTGSVTHSWNMDQRFVELAFRAEGETLSVQAPARAADAPPGFYMLFVLDDRGVPSVAKMVRVNVATDPNPAIAPVLAAPANQSGQAGVAASLQLVASDPNGDVLRYSASGLPTGLGIDTASGLISGIPVAGGTFNVTVAASDGVNTATANFTWTIIDAPPLALVPPPPPAPVLLGTTITFNGAVENGVNPRFRWNFGDGSPETPWSTSPQASHQFAEPGVYTVTLTAVDERGIETRRSFLQSVHLPLAAGRANASTPVTVENGAAGARIWMVNGDNNSVSVFDHVTRARIAEIAVGTAPRSVAVAPNGTIWVTNKGSQSISVINPGTLSVQRTISLPRGSQPYGLAMGGSFAYVALEGSGQVMKYNADRYSRTATLNVGPNPRHVSVSADGATVYVSRFITPPLPGEATATVQTRPGGVPVGGEVVVINAANMAVLRTVVLAHSDREDDEAQGRGVPNYLGAVAISPDASQAWVPSKQDNILRGALRDGTGLNFQNTVRAISSRIVLPAGAEDLAARIDHDDASLASAAVFDPRGVFLFVALETSREVAVLDAHRGIQLFRIDTGRAPQGLAISPDGATLYVNNFMDRTLGAYDLRPLLVRGEPGQLPLLAAVAAISTERLAPQVLLGKQLFYDARDPRLARDRYMSCATCHSDGGHDGRVWDLTGFGEGLRNTVNLRGRGGTAGMGAHGGLHWSNNFDEVQDFEGQIRQLAGGTGLMADADYFAGTRAFPMGDPKAGLSADLDALAAYVASLNAFDISPFRPGANSVSAAAAEGREIFLALNCGACHSGTKFSASGAATLVDIGTIKPASGGRLGGTLEGFDPPTLRDVWATAPYLHDGSAATLEEAVRAHRDVAIGEADLAKLVAYLRELGREEGAAPAPAGTGAGLTGRYYNNMTLSGAPVLVRQEAVNFGWGNGSPGQGVNSNNFSVRWSGWLDVPATGTYVFQTVADDGIRLRVNGELLIDKWVVRGSTTDTSAAVNLVAGERVRVTLEYFENTGTAVARLRWWAPGTTSFVAIPADRLTGD
jgi:YVTN family beta-propeller protein